MSHQLALLGGQPVRERPFTSWPIFGKREEERVLAAIRSGHWGRLDGREVAEFENRFATMHGCQHGIAVVNGTVSLRLALIAAGLEAESEVIIPPYTFFSTASAVIEANKCRCSPMSTWRHSISRRRRWKVRSRRAQRAIIPVHFAGQPADMDAIVAYRTKAQVAGH